MVESALRGRDLVILILLFIVLHHCWYEQIRYNFRLEPVWFVENPVSSMYPLDLVQPAVLDLNSDGKLEMIAIVKTSNEVDDRMVGEDNALYVLQVLDIGETSVVAVDEVFHPPILQGILLTGSQINAPNMLAAGPTAPGKGFIAVSFANLTIAGFSLTKDSDGSSHQLKQLWLKDLVNISIELLSVLTEHDRDVKSGCQRVVQLQYFNPNKITFDHAQETDDEDILLVSITRSAASISTSNKNASAVCTAVTIILALQPSTAQLLWVHRNEELGEASLSASLPSSTGFTLDLRKVLLEKQSGAGKDWSLFRDSFLKLLPKLGHWFGEEDERLVTGTFTRGRLGGVRPHSKQAPAATGKGKNNDKATSNNANKGLSKKQQQLRKLILEESNDRNKDNKQKKAKLLQFGLPKATQNKQRRINNNKVNIEQLSTLTNRSSVAATKEVKNAVNHHFHNRHHYHRQHNVAILRHAHGLTAVTLQTGVHLATLVLSPHLVYGDIDGDRHVDSFHFLPDDVRQPVYNEAPCWGAVLSGLPPTAQLFNTSALCGVGMQSRRTSIGRDYNTEHIPQNRRRRQYRNKGRRHNNNNMQRNNGTAAFPPTVEEVGYAPPLLLSPASRYEDIAAIVYSSVGVLTAIDRKGEVKWQDFTVAQPFNFQAKDRFQPKLAMFRPLSLHDHHVENGELDGHVDDENDPMAVLVAQEKSLSLFTLQGNFLTSVGVPSSLVSRPILDYDFDGDGVRDLIVPTEGALIGYRTVLTPQFYPLFLPLLVLLVIAVLVFISRLQWDQESGVNGMKQQGLNRAKKEMAGWIKALRSTRGTDALHLD